MTFLLGFTRLCREENKGSAQIWLEAEGATCLSRYHVNPVTFLPVVTCNHGIKTAASVEWRFGTNVMAGKNSPVIDDSALQPIPHLRSVLTSTVCTSSKAPAPWGLYLLLYCITFIHSYARCCSCREWTMSSS